MLWSRHIWLLSRNMKKKSKTCGVPSRSEVSLLLVLSAGHLSTLVHRSNRLLRLAEATMYSGPSCLVKVVRQVLLLLLLPRPKSSSHPSIKCLDRLLSTDRLLHRLPLPDSLVSRGNILRVLDLVVSPRSLLRPLRLQVQEREAVLLDLLRVVQLHLRSIPQCRIPDLDSRLRYQPTRHPTMVGCNSTLPRHLANHNRNNS
jgi:hypothetical protein